MRINLYFQSGSDASTATASGTDAGYEATQAELEAVADGTATDWGDSSLPNNGL